LKTLPFLIGAWNLRLPESSDLIILLPVKSKLKLIGNDKSNDRKAQFLARLCDRVLLGGYYNLSFSLKRLVFAIMALIIEVMAYFSPSVGA
jgi:hypothetical protein